jgi:hypothetical protein
MRGSLSRTREIVCPNHPFAQGSLVDSATVICRTNFCCRDWRELNLA